MTSGSIVPGVLAIGNVNVDLTLGSHGAWLVLGTELLMNHLDLRVGGDALMAAQRLGHDLFGGWLRTQFQAVQMHWLRAVTSVTVLLPKPQTQRLG